MEVNKYPNLINEYLQSKNIQEDDCKNKPPCLNKKKTCGIFTAMRTCGTFVSFDEMIRSESTTEASQFLQEISTKTKSKISYVIYDNACKLKETFKKTNLINEIAGIKFYIDRFHQNNHKQTICKTELNMDYCSELNGYNSQACEQSYFKLNQYKHMCKHFTCGHYNFFFLWIFDQFNKRNKINENKNN
jgi:hypothetical protein